MRTHWSKARQAFACCSGVAGAWSAPLHPYVSLAWPARGLDEGAVAGMLESYGAAGNAMTARAQGAFMTQAAIGAPATVVEKIARFMRYCELDGLMFIFDEYPSGLAMAGREILPRLRADFP